MPSKQLVEQIDSLVERVLHGELDPKTAVSDILGEQLSPGMRNALSKGKVKMNCPSCDLAIPVYPGKYPKQCPECGVEFGEPGVEIPKEEPEEESKEE